MVADQVVEEESLKESYCERVAPESLAAGKTTAEKIMQICPAEGKVGRGREVVGDLRWQQPPTRKYNLGT
jgi:hypothetical protein